MVAQTELWLMETPNQKRRPVLVVSRDEVTRYRRYGEPWRTLPVAVSVVDENHLDAETGEPIQLHGGTVHWNEHRRRWVMIALESWGTSMLGEIWYAEADTPLGPWEKAVKIVTHDDYSFYNPKQHPMFDQQNGRFIYFEGTYTHTFSSNTDPTPRYDYNQIMYRLDLADERLGLEPRH